MERTGLITGSLDFILTPSGEYVFLEVNPSGQYDMISKPCNYHLDKAIATFLYNSDKDEKLTFHKRQFAVEEN